MKQKLFSAKEFNAIVKGAKTEVKGTFKNPFVIVNLLNKAVKGDFNKLKNEGVTFSYENLKLVASVLKSMHGNRYAFDTCVLKKYKGVFVRVSTSKKCPKFGYDLVDISIKGYSYYIPISLTIDAFFNEFAKVAKVDIKESEKAEKDAAKKAEKAKKQATKDKKDFEIVAKVFGTDFANTCNIETIREKANIIKNANKRK